MDSTYPQCPSVLKVKLDASALSPLVKLFTAQDESYGAAGRGGSSRDGELAEASHRWQEGDRQGAIKVEKTSFGIALHGIWYGYGVLWMLLHAWALLGIIKVV